MIFFSLVAIIFLTVRVADLKGSAKNLEESEARELVKKIAISPEFSLDSMSCASCIDLDKVIILKDRQSYKGFWNLDLLVIEKIYPEETGECMIGSYPECKTVTIVNKTTDYGAVSSAFVSLCYWKQAEEGYIKCEMGMIHASGKQINK